MKKKKLLKDIRDLYKIIDIEVDKNIENVLRHEHENTIWQSTTKLLIEEIKQLKAEKLENNIMRQSLVSCENALREKEVIITYLEMRGN